MERILDKTIVLAGCLLTAACLLVETGSGAELAASDARLLALAIAMLIAVLCSALTEAASMPAGVLALSAYCAAACFVPAALAFVPLALYDCARCIHRADVLRFSGALALIAIVACLMRATVPPLSTASLLCSAAAACILSVRTSTTLARQRIAWSTRDALASQALSLRKRNRSLRDSLDKMSAMTAQNAEKAAIDGRGATRRTADGAAVHEFASEIAGARGNAGGDNMIGKAEGGGATGEPDGSELGESGSSATGEPGGGATREPNGNARRKLSGGNASRKSNSSGTTGDAGVGSALSDSHVRREPGSGTSNEFASSNASREQLRPAPFTCLTEREYEVARLVAEGLDNREISAIAYLSEGTVRNNISSILSKMNLKNRTQIAVAYYKSKGPIR